ncbi:integrase [Streptomyces sp. NPDC058175]|uniref:integrase n=1 Tax=Streptomyces sp. NPDC058175 TaxID=3346367 RepID=UPI0036E6D73A
MSAAPDPDPYLLPLPQPETPVVLPHRVVVPDTGHYAQAIWPLAALSANPSGTTAALWWIRCPAAFDGELRLAAWTMINGELRPAYVRERGVRMRSRLGSDRAKSTVTDWFALAKWLDARGITTLADCDTNVLHAYGHHLLGKAFARSRTQSVLASLTRLWAFDQLSACPSGIGRPPWDELGADDYLPAVTSSAGENTTEALAETTMGPLLIWSMRLVDDFADDILAAWAETKRLTQLADDAPGGPAAAAALHALIAAEALLPARLHRGRMLLARSYIGGVTGATRHQINGVGQQERLVAAVARRPGPCPLPTPVTGQVAGRPWREKIDFTETGRLMRHLGTAAFIVCSYLTGMRPGEVLGLRTGCCPDPQPDADGTIGRHLIRGHEYKNATDEDGNHQSAGEERDVPWVAIAPVVQAIRVLERMVPDGALLFDGVVHDMAFRKSGAGSLKHPGLRARIRHFIAWANAEATALGLPEQIIPPDPRGEVGLGRFRRSLAWNIARRPGGPAASLPSPSNTGT